MTAPQLDFDGESYDRETDSIRLSTQLTRLKSMLNCMPNTYHTPDSLMLFTGANWASVSARLRDLRKPKFGGYDIRRKRIDGGLWAYGLFTEGE